MTTNENISSSNPTNEATGPSEALLTAIGLRFCSSLTFKAISKEDMQAANLQADNATMDCLKKVLTVIGASKADCWQLMNNPNISALPEEAFQKKARLSPAEQQKVDQQSLLTSLSSKLAAFTAK